MRALPKICFLSVEVAACTTIEFMEWLAGSAQSAKRENPVLITYLNAWCSNIAADDAKYASILSRANCVYADGQAIVWASRLLGTPLPERVNAADFIIDFLRMATAADLAIYLIGSVPGVAEKAAARFAATVPGLKIVGAESGYFNNDNDEVVARVRAASPDILILGMGVPAQEIWAAANLSRFDVRAVWCVGAMFEYYGEARLRAPIWMRRAGLEWAFRLVLEPRRLWRRYILGNARFVCRVARVGLSKRAAKDR